MHLTKRASVEQDWVFLLIQAQNRNPDMGAEKCLRPVGILLKKGASDTRW